MRTAIWTTLCGLSLVGAGIAHADEAKPTAEAPKEPLSAAEKLDQEQAQRETNHPRPPLEDEAPGESPAWTRRLEIGAGAALVSRPFATTKADNIRYDSAIGWGIHVNWNLVSWLRLHTYFVDAHHDLRIPAGSLTTSQINSVSPTASVSDTTAKTFVFGAKVAPTWNFSGRARGWISAGVGWGRVQFPTMTVTEPNGVSFVVRERDSSLVEFPIGIGVAYDVWPRWISIHYEASGAPVIGQAGTAHEPAQAVDADGQLRDVAPFGAFDASFVQTLGVSLIL